jgi:hypothetical protein
VASPDPVVGDALSSPPVVIGTIEGTMVLSVEVSVELPEATVDGLSVGKSVVSAAAVAGTLTVGDALSEVEAEMPVPTELSVPVVAGTGTAVVPSGPVEVLRLKIGDELASVAGTATTVVPDEPVIVLDVVAGPDVVLTGMGTTVVLPSVPVIVLEVTDTGAVPVEGETPVEAVSPAMGSVTLVSDPSEGEAVLMTEPVADAVDALSVTKTLERPEFKEEAALDKMLENPEARDCVTAASVADAATPDNSELSEEAKLDRAEDAALVTDPVLVAVGLPLASDSTDDWAEETALANSEAAEETALVAAASPEVESEESPVVPSVSEGAGISRPPVPRRPGEVVASVPLVASAPSEESVDVPSSSDAMEPIRPGVPVPVLDTDVNVLLVAAAGEVKGMAVVFSVSGTVDNGIGSEAFSALEVAAVKDAEGVVDAVPSIMVDRPTVIAPRDGKSEALASLELFSEELVPVGEGSADGAKPVVPTASREAERVEIMAVELAVGDASSAGRRPPDVPAKGPRIPVFDELEIESDSARLLAIVGSARSLETWPVDPTL